jgi:hypothetical protein
MDREEILSRRAAASARQLAVFDGWDEETMTTAAVCGPWTAFDLLAHVCGWARWDLETISALLAGEDTDLSVLDDVDGFNDRLVTERRGWTVAQVLDEMAQVEAATNRFIGALPEESGGAGTIRLPLLADPGGLAPGRLGARRGARGRAGSVARSGRRDRTVIWAMIQHSVIWVIGLQFPLNV